MSVCIITLVINKSDSRFNNAIIRFCNHLYNYVYRIGLHSVLLPVLIHSLPCLFKYKICKNMNFGTNIVNTTIIKYSLRPLISLDRTVLPKFSNGLVKLALQYLCRQWNIAMENVWAKQQDWKCSFVACAHPSVPPGESPFPDFQRERTSARRLQFCCFLLHKMLSQRLQFSEDLSSLLTVIRWNGQHLSKFTNYI